MFTHFFQFLSQFYKTNEYPALQDQILSWQLNQPFAKKKILDATPVFHNTLLKHLALLIGGANLTVGFGNGIPFCPKTLELLKQWNIPIIKNGETSQTFDIVLDCGGVNANITTTYGYVELTHTGFEKYRNHQVPVFLADESKIKTIETSLGTGEGLWRALKKLGYTSLKNKKIIIFGGGKVGRGVAIYGLMNQCDITIVDYPQTPILPGCHFIDINQAKQIETTLKDCFCLISCTGIKHALYQKFDVKNLIQSTTLIANMGLEDEFGPEIPSERVLNHKQALNFLLDEPTHLKFIDPTMALHNEGALLLITQQLHQGLNYPPPELENKILKIVSQNGCINQELTYLEKIS